MHKKYTYKNGKKFGPYYYETKRVNGKVVTTYLGRKHSEKKLNKSIWSIFAIAILGVLLLAFLFYPGTLTGRVALDIDSSYAPGELIDGKFNVVLSQGELLPEDTSVSVSVGSDSKEILVSDILTSAGLEYRVQNGDFYIEDSSISGSGRGYGIKGIREVYPDVGFRLEIIGGEIIDSELSDEIDSAGSGGGSEDDKDAAEGSEISGSENSGEGNVSESDPMEINETEIPEETPEFEGNESTSTNETESSQGSEEQGNQTGDTSVGGESDISEDEAHVGVNETEEGSDESEENSEGFESGSGGVREESENIESGPSEDLNPSAGITGAVVSDLEKGEFISGSVNVNGNFEFTVSEGSSIFIVSGSVKTGDKDLAESDLKISTEGNKVIISTEYSEQEEGFGSDFSGKESLELELDIAQFGFMAENDSELSARLIYNDEILAEENKRIKVIGSFPEANATLLNKTSIKVNTTQYGAILGSPVRWTKKVESDFPARIKVEIPASAENVSVNLVESDVIEKQEGLEVEDTREINESSSGSGEENMGSVEEGREEIIEDDVSEIESESVDVKIDLEGSVISGAVVSGSREGQRISIPGFLENFARITGLAVDNSTNSDDIQEIEVEITGKEEFVEIEYYTDAPYSLEEEFSDKKRVVVVGPEDAHYENVLIFAEVPEYLDIRNKDVIRVFWHEGATNIVPENVLDLDGDGIFDYVEWVAPHLSNQTFDIIIITGAQHLDSNRTFVSDIFESVKELDGNWSETIPSENYVRVTFERNLTSDRDITVYPRNISGEPRIDVYEENGEDIIAQFANLSYNEYNKVFLTNLNGSQDTFDLQILNGDLQFDHIIDPINVSAFPAGDIDSCPLGNTTFAIGWCQGEADPDDICGLAVHDTNGTEITSINIDTDVDLGAARVALSCINSSDILVAKVTNTATTSPDLEVGKYSFSGSSLTLVDGFDIIDGSIGTGSGDNEVDLTLTILNDTYAFVGFTNDQDEDVDFYGISLSNLAPGAETQIDNNARPEGNWTNDVDFCSISDTRAVSCWFDDRNVAGGFIRAVVVNETSGTAIAVHALTTTIGEESGVACDCLREDKVAFAYFDSDSNDVFIEINDYTGDSTTTILDATSIDANAGTDERVAVAEIEVDGASYFGVAFSDTNAGDIKAGVYNSSGTEITAPFTITTEENTDVSYRIVDIVGSQSRRGLNTCNGTFTVAYTNSSDVVTYDGFHINGTVWDGGCGVAAEESLPILIPDNLNRVVVALQNATNELQLLTWDDTNSNFTVSIIADMEDHVESIDIDDADNDGINEVVASVESIIFNDTLNLFEINSSNNWEKTVIDDNMIYHAEDLEIGDADNDGLNEIVVGLEYVSGLVFNHSSVAIYELDGASWEKTNISKLSEDFVIQDVDIGDIDSDGYNEIVVLRNNAHAIFTEDHQVLGFNSPLETGSGWEEFNITNIKSNSEDKEAERLEIANVDTDPDLEIVYNSYLGAGSATGVLRVLDYNGNDWDEFFIAENTGLIDGLDVFDLDSNGIAEVITGERPLGSAREFVLYNYTSSETYSSKILNASLTEIRDAGFGDYDNDGEIEAVGSWGNAVIYMDNITGTVEDAYINFTASGGDSAQVGVVAGNNTKISFVVPTPLNGSSVGITGGSSLTANLTTISNGRHYSFLDFNDDLVFWMGFDESNSSGDPIDLTDYSNNGSLNGNANLTGLHYWGNSTGLDGNGDYVSFGTSGVSEIDFNRSSEFTISAWFYYTSGSDTFARILDADTDNGGYAMHIGTGAGTDQFSCVVSDQGNTNRLWTYEGAVTQNAWHHGVCVYNGTGHILYLDNVVQASPTTSGTGTFNTANELRIGTRNAGTDRVIDGFIDEILIFNRTLSADEISSLYNSSTTQYENNFTGLGAGEYNFIGHVVDTEARRLNTKHRTVILSANVNSCTELNTAGTTYTQSANIDVPSTVTGACINITAPNIVFDGAGYWIVNETHNIDGIYSNQLNTTIKNSNISIGSSNAGIRLFTSNDSKVYNNTFYSGGSGLRLETSSFVVVQNNTAGRTATGYLIEEVSSFNNLTANNHFNGTGSADNAGILLVDSGTNFNIVRDGIIDSAQSGVYVLSSPQYNKIINYSINNSDFNGVILNIGPDHNEFYNLTINSSGIGAIRSISSTFSPENNSFYNITILNTTSIGHDFALISNGNQNGLIVDTYIENYSLGANTLTFRETGKGEIQFLEDITGGGTNLSDDIKIKDNFVEVDSANEVGFNVSANVTLYNSPGSGFGNPEIKRNHVACPVGVCNNFTALDASTVIFNVSYWTNYSIGEKTEVDACRILNVSGTIYTQSANIEVPGSVTGACIDITAENVVFDGNGYWISNRSHDIAGVRANAVNSTIKNTNVSMGFGAIAATGISVVGNNSLIYNNTAEFSFNGILMSSAAHFAKIENNTAFNNSRAISVNGLYNNFTGNNLLNYSSQGFFFQGDSINFNTVSDNILESYTGTGLYLFQSDYNTFINNTINSSSTGIVFLFGADHNEFENITILNSSSNAVQMNNAVDAPENNSFKGVEVIGTNSSHFDLLIQSGIDGISLIDSYFTNYSFEDSGSNFMIFSNTEEGQIKFLEDINGSGTNLSDDIRISSNLVTVESSSNSELNRSANVSLFGSPGSGFSFPRIDRNGVACPAGVCNNFTALDASTVIFNVSYWTNYSIGEGNIAPITPTPEINSTDGTNRTGQDLNGFDILSDSDADRMNVSVRWFNNSVLHLEQNHNDSYVNGTLFIATLNSGNTTKEENWTFSMRVFDGTSYTNWMNSSELEILNTPPESPSITSPADGDSTTDRTPAFSWKEGSDDDSDTQVFELNITLVASSLCSDPSRHITGISGGSHELSEELQCFSDNNDNYNWSLRAYDGEAYSDWSDFRRLNISSLIQISLPNNTIEFGQIGASATNDTSDDSPLPFLMQNDGNSIVNITIEATDLWNTQSNPNQYYQFKIDNYTLENSSFVWDLSLTSFTNIFASGSPGLAIAELNHTNATDTVEVDINITVPPNEGAGVRSSDVTFTASLAEG